MQPFIIQSGKKPVNFNVGDPLYPDHWFEASVLWELQAADLSKSSVHKGDHRMNHFTLYTSYQCYVVTGGIGKLESGRGIGLRFPRYFKHVLIFILI